ncbi:hypothetical protein L3Y34_005369 [Caenorhabditis briggsae]|uniref:Uncharacterized protein n=2 Tax=Caenorhabditis briggsae TaxID=6238 RepID=A0AAE9D6V1_CAEBR|nr:hypothetical protein L3Y34_005369 [Caenorhabditis briggsae]
MALYNGHTAMKSYSPDVPLESMALDMQEKNIPTEDNKFDELTLAIGARCHARCQLEFEFAKECNLVMKPLSMLGNRLNSVGVDGSNWEKFEKDVLVPICAPIRECTRKVQANAFVLGTFGIIVRCLNCYEKLKDSVCFYNHSILIEMYARFRRRVLRGNQ